jgi:MFS family permease
MKTYMPLLLSSLWVTAALPGNVFTALCIDRIGRRPFLLIGIGGIIMTNIFECALQANFLGTDNVAGQRAGVFFIFLFIFFWSSFLDASQYLYLSEIFPTHIRSQGIAFGTFGMYVGTIIVLTTGPIALDVITWKFFLVLILMPAVEWVGIFFFLPETKQRSLDDINQAFGEKVALHYYGATKEEEDVYEKVIHGNVASGESGDEKRHVVEQHEAVSPV